MGLAPYGSENSEETKSFIDKIKSEVVDIKVDGSIFIHLHYTTISTYYINEW